MNKVILIGNLTRDPENRQAGQTNVTAFGLASNRKWTNKQGQRQEEATFVDCNAFGSVGGVVSQYCRKGSKVLVEGRLKYDKWTAQDGSNRHALSVTVESLELLDPPKNNNQGGHQNQNNQGYNNPQNQGGYPQNNNYNNQPQNQGYNNPY